MKRALTPMQSRLLAVLLLLALLALFAASVNTLLQRAHSHYDEAISDRLDHTARFLRIAGQREAVEANVAAIKRKDARRQYLKATAPALAAAEVQQMAQASIDAQGLKVESTQIVPHKDEEGRRKVTVNFRLRGQLPVVQKTLYVLETTLPYLYIDNLTIRSNPSLRFFKPVPGVEPEVLIQFDVYGYALITKNPATPVRTP